MQCCIPRSKIDAQWALEAVPLMMKALGKVTDFNKRDGGAFCLMHRETGKLLIDPTVIGQITTLKVEDCLAYCREKAERLRRHKDHWLSWQSRDVSQKQWGGAICDGDYIWSFSGLTEEQDEALMLMSAHVNGRICNGDPENLAQISGNSIILGNPYLFWLPQEDSEVE